MLLKEILEGWGNWARLQFKTLDQEIVHLSKTRLLKTMSHLSLGLAPNTVEGLKLVTIKSSVLRA